VYASVRVCVLVLLFGLLIAKATSHHPSSTAKDVAAICPAPLFPPFRWQQASPCCWWCTYITPAIRRSENHVTVICPALSTLQAVSGIPLSLVVYGTLTARVFGSVLPLVAGAAYFLGGAAAQRALMAAAARLTFRQEALEGQLRCAGCVHVRVLCLCICANSLPLHTWYNRVFGRTALSLGWPLSAAALLAFTCTLAAAARLTRPRARGRQRLPALRRSLSTAAACLAEVCMRQTFASAQAVFEHSSCTLGRGMHEADLRQPLNGFELPRLHGWQVCMHGKAGWAPWGTPCAY